jgi:hypothetical protein
MLVELDCSHIPRITDEGVRSVVEHQPNLAVLRLVGCTGIKGEAFCFEQLLSAGLSLQRSLVLVDLSHCPALMPNVVYW